MSIHPSGRGLIATHDPDRPWDAFPPDLWERICAAALVDSDWDPAEVGEAAGLDQEQIAALKLWCKQVEFEDEARRSGAVPLSDAELDKRLGRIDAEIARLATGRPRR